jgi:pimeloyl-ACP methyl ester carboxylesterase
VARTTWRRRLAAALAGLAVATAALYVLVWEPHRAAVRFLERLGGAEPAAADFEPRAAWTRDAFTLGPGPGGPPRPAIVVVHGVTEAGVRDARLWRLAEAIDAAGLTAHVPEVPGMKRMGDGSGDVGRIRRAFEDVAGGRVPGADPTRFGVLGVSLGGALALRAAAGMPARDAPRALLLVGAPDDTLALAREWFRRPDAPADAPPETRLHAEMGRFARLSTLRLALGALVSGADAGTIGAWLSDPPEYRIAALPADVALETDAGRRFASAAAAGAGAAEEDLAWVLDGAARGGLATMSPASWDADLAPLRAPCFLIHGAGDPLVASSEMTRLAARLAPRAPVRTLESRLLEHVGVGSPGLAETWRHVRFMKGFLDAVGEAP